MREKLKQFIGGCYGGDRLNTVISVTALASFIVGALVGISDSLPCVIISSFLHLIAAAALGFSVFRMLSHDLTARKAENDWYAEHIIAPLKRSKNEAATRSRQRKTHKFFKCPKCRQTVRVPRGKGKIRITCPKCGEVFVKET